MLITDFELECNLYATKDFNNNKKKSLLEFTATAVSNRTTTAGYVAGTVASQTNAYRIASRSVYNFVPFTHGVTIDGVDFVITAKEFYTPRKTGKQFTKQKRLIILTLE